MKKQFLCVLSLLLIISCSFCLISCTKVSEDYKEVRANLRANGYDVLVGSTPTESTELLSELLYSMVYSLNDDSDTEQGEILLESFSEDYEDLIHEINVVIAGVSKNGEGEDLLLIVYFDDKNGLKDNYAIFEDFFEFIKSSSFDADQALIDNADLKYGKSGKAIYLGTPQAFKDAK